MLSASDILCCLDIVVGLTIGIVGAGGSSINKLSSILACSNSFGFNLITGDVPPKLFFLKHILEARARCCSLGSFWAAVCFLLELTKVNRQTRWSFWISFSRSNNSLRGPSYRSAEVSPMQCTIF